VIKAPPTTFLNSVDMQTRQWFSELFAQIGPALGFWQKARAYRNAYQSVTGGVWMKIQIDTISFDPAGICDVTTNHRIRPTMAGYYQVNVAAWQNNVSNGDVGIYFNGSGPVELSGTGIIAPAVSDVMYFNGITDYAEAWCLFTYTGNIGGAAWSNYLSIVGPF